MVTIKEAYFEGETFKTNEELVKKLKDLRDDQVIGLQANEVVKRTSARDSSVLLTANKWKFTNPEQQNNTIQLTEIIPMPVGAWRESGLTIGQEIPGHHINVVYRSILNLPINRVRGGLYDLPVSDREQKHIYLFDEEINGKKERVPYFRITTLSNEGLPIREEMPTAVGLMDHFKGDFKIDGKRNPILTKKVTELYHFFQKKLVSFDLNAFSTEDYTTESPKGSNVETKEDLNIEIPVVENN